MKSKAHTRVETRSSLLDTLFLSEKRTDLLLLLKEEGPKNSEDIKDVLDFPWKSITPQIKKLTDWGLVLEDHGVYSLSEMGAVIASNAEFFLSTLSVYEDNLDFWSDHDVSPVPFHILNKIGELSHVRIIEQDFSNVFRIPEEIMTNLMSSKRIMSFISIFHPFSLLLLFEYIQKDIEATTIVTEKVLEAFQTEYNSDIPILKINNPIINKALIEYKKEIKNVFCSKLSDFLVYEGDLKPMSMIITDKIFILSLLDKKGRLTTRFLITFEPQALKWGEELFMYYKERSKSVPSSLSIL
jgi:predicted transcriptional regulator